MNKQRSEKQQSIFRFAILVSIIVGINILANVFYTRVDLTGDKRFTLNDSTKQMLRRLDDQVFIKVYLTGDLNAGFKRLEQSTKDILNEFRYYGNSNIQYQFEDPLLNKTNEGKKKIYEEMMKHGLQPTNIQTASDDAYSEKIVIPGATIFYKGKESSVNLLLNDNGVQAQTALNNSVSRLESKFSNVISQLTSTSKIKIAITRGHGEMPIYNLYDIITSLTDFYDIDTLDIRKYISIDTSYKAIIIAKPMKAFDDQEKFKLDQFIMRGGNVLCLIDGMVADLDSLKTQASFLATDNNLNLQEQFFKYGCRINPSLLLDLQCNPVPLLVNYKDNQPDFRLFPCPYFPVITSKADHIITKQIDAIQTEFISTIDTVANKDIKKTILLSSSAYSKQVFTPWLVDFKNLKDEPDRKSFNKKNLPVAVLIEGKFSSAFVNLIPESFQKILRDSIKLPFIEKGRDSKMIVIADGNIIKNDFSSQGKPYTLGYNIYSKENFDNKNFILNCVDYLCGRPQQIVTRSKDIKLRVLDVERIKKEKTFWRAINILFPIFLIIVFGLIYAFIRLRRYAS